MATEPLIPLDPEPVEPKGILLDPTIQERVGHAYKSVAGPVTSALATGLQPFLYALSLGHAGSGWASPGTAARGIAGAVVPQTPTDAALMYALGPGAGKVGDVALTTKPALNAILSGAGRALGTTAVGAGVAEATGEDPLIGAMKGAFTGGMGELGQGVKRFLVRGKVPRSPSGVTTLREYLGDRYTGAIQGDIPAIGRYYNNRMGYDDLINLQDAKVSQKIGNEIYKPFEDILNQTNLRNTHINFPFLRPGPYGRLVLPPTLSEVLPAQTVAILRRAGGLTVKESLDIVHQLNALGRRQKDDAIGAAAREFARSIQNDVRSTLVRLNPTLGRAFDAANKEYRTFQGFLRVLDKHINDLAPGGKGGPVGLDPAKWREVLVKSWEDVPEALMPRLHNAVSFGGLEAGAGAVYREPRGFARAYTAGPVGHVGLPLFGGPKIEIPEPMRSSKVIWPRAIPPAVVSGMEAAQEQP